MGTRIAPGQSGCGCENDGGGGSLLILSPAVAALPGAPRLLAHQGGPSAVCGKPEVARAPARDRANGRMRSTVLDQEARLRRVVRGLIADCRSYGASKAALAECHTIGDLEALKSRLLRQMMDAPRRAS
jgi:hypothetical protein